MSISTHHQASKLAIAAILSGFMIAAPAFAQTDDSSAPAPSAAMTATAPAPATAMTAESPKKMSHVEARIQTLHDKLNITAAQESQWKAVADVMRDNAESVHKLVEERHANTAHMSAIDDLKSYAAIAQAHADGAQKLIPVFEALYDTMTPDQKTNADSVFGAFEGHPERKATSGSAAPSTTGK